MSSSPSEGSTEWGFAGQEDAARYLREVLRLWTAWIAGLAVLVTNNGVVLLVGAVVVIVLLVWFVRPIQRRAEALVVADSASGQGSDGYGRGTPHDRSVKAFAYGEEPLEAAVELAGQSSAWLFARKLVLAATVVAFAVVVVQSFGG